MRQAHPVSIHECPSILTGSRRSLKNTLLVKTTAFRLSNDNENVINVSGSKLQLVRGDGLSHLYQNSGKIGADLPEKSAMTKPSENYSLA